MKLSLALRLACASAFLLCCRATPFPFNMSAEGSGDGEPEILVPTSYTTRGPSPAPLSPTPRVTTAVRIKNFILNEVVDFLRENLLLILVVSALLIVIIFIVCCASVMSHKRKLKAYYPSSFPAKKYVDQKDKKGGARTFDEVPEKARDSQKTEPLDSNRQFQTDISAQNRNLRTPSKALVGEKGKDPKQKVSETQKVEQDRPKVEEPVAKPKEEEEESKEPKPNPSPSQPLVCLCHLRNTSPPKQDTDKDK
ncbi:transmembrane protein 119 [Conger conger]|uniref:transmembrane protein 119 n=1 Tax=Conger conger TaxID=82655 RepID=UPI002A5AA90B|nr:transmembrane protein 119 [Conger conger]XP_061117525.1 transmembrane protein 119 [Conger conger]